MTTKYALTLALTGALCACGDNEPAPTPVDDTSTSARITRPTLEGRAVLPALTFAAGPPAGTRLSGDPAPAPPNTINGVPIPFASQPVQGFSAIIEGDGDTFWAMPDNGFGRRENSDDFLLRVYQVRPSFKTRQGGSGAVGVAGFVSLRDPDHRIDFPITNQAHSARLLTGADLDPESLRRAPDGSLWFGEEFGPFLVHTDASGVVLEAPIELPDSDSPSGVVRSPQNLRLQPGEVPTIDRSSGIEGLGQWRHLLYPMLEGPLNKDVDAGDARLRRIYEYDTAARRYTGRTFKYRTRDDFMSVHDLTAIDQHRMLVTETDDNEGAVLLSDPARHKKIYRIDLRRVDAAGILIKEEVVDLVNIADPDHLSLPGRPGDVGLGDPFAFPFITIEGVLPLGGNRLLVSNDNNLPSSLGRNPALPDNNELIVIKIPGLPGN